MAGVRTLKTGISGVRGVVGDSLTPGLVVRFAQAFGTYVKGGRVALGRDTRPSGEMVRSALIGGLLASGCEVRDFGVVPVPTLQIAVARHDFDGGVAITASHNPQEWNALKFIRSDGVFLYPYQAEELLNIYHQGEFILVPSDQVGGVFPGAGALEEHSDIILRNTDLDAIRAAGLRVVLDCCNGAGAMLAPRVLDALGCREVLVINGEPNGLFAHKPEPIPAHLSGLCEAVRAAGADLGLAQDADADRLALVDERGLAVSEEFTLALAAESVAARRAPVPIVANLSTSRMIDEVAQRYGCFVRRTPVGEINVVEAMRQEEAKFRAAGLTTERDWVFGGEGNGGVIDPFVHYCRDSHRAMALILDGLARSGKPLSAWIADSFSPSAITKLKVGCPVSKVQQIMLAVTEHYADRGHLDDTEGVRVLWPDRSWLHIRPSNTEPVMRVVAEADTEDEAGALANEAAGVLAAVLNSRPPDA